MSWIVSLISSILESFFMGTVKAIISGGKQKRGNRNRIHYGLTSSSRLSEENGDVDDEDIWFDGVDKKLLDIHCKKRKLVDGNDKSLTTRATHIKPLPTTHKHSSRRYNNVNGTKNNKNANHHQRPPNYTEITKELAIDCEMVECSFNKSVVARVSIVNLYGHPLMDKYVAPPSKVTDYRTKYSGIRKSDLMGAPEFDVVQGEVRKMLSGKIVVGHALHNDFKVLKLFHPKEDIRDTSKYFKTYFQGKTPSLKKLSECLLGVSVQTGEHDSVQDAQAAMKLYVMHRDKWNQVICSQKEAILEHKAARAKKKRNRKKIKTFYATSS